jgi:hypothetical protein
MLRWAMRDASAWHAALEAGRVPPDLEPPELLPGLAPWYEDFLALSTDRQIGMGIGPIPESSIERHTADWPDEDREMFTACIRAMDAVYLEQANKRDGDDAPDPALASSDNPARDAFRAAFR